MIKANQGYIYILYSNLLQVTWERGWTPEFLRPGNVIIFQKPGAAEKVGLETGLVLTVWKGQRSPKQHSEQTPITSCAAFRVLILDVSDPNQESPDFRTVGFGWFWRFWCLFDEAWAGSFWCHFFL